MDDRVPTSARKIHMLRPCQLRTQRWTHPQLSRSQHWEGHRVASTKSSMEATRAAGRKSALTKVAFNCPRATRCRHRRAHRRAQPPSSRAPREGGMQALARQGSGVEAGCEHAHSACRLCNRVTALARGGTGRRGKQPNLP